MRAQAVDHVVFVSVLHLFFYFFQREVNDVVMVYFQRRYGITETQPQSVQKIDFVGGQIWRMRPEDFVKLVPVGQMNFQVELRLLIAEFFPGFADLPRLLLVRFLCRTPRDNGAGTERGSGTKDAIP